MVQRKKGLGNKLFPTLEKIGNSVVMSLRETKLTYFFSLINNSIHLDMFVECKELSGGDWS